MSDLTFKKFVDFVNLEGDVSDDQINEIFGLFRNNQKLDKLKKEREKLKGMSAQKKAELDQALKDFKDGKKPTPKGAIALADLEDALSADDRKFLAKRDRLATEGQIDESTSDVHDMCRADKLKVGQKFRLQNDRAQPVGKTYTVKAKPVVGDGATHMSELVQGKHKTVAPVTISTDKGDIKVHALAVVAIV